MARSLNISAVVFDVKYDRAGRDVDEADAMRQVFGFSDPVTFRRESRTSYHSGDYQRLGSSTIWTGRIVLLREMKQLEAEKDRRAGFRFTEGAESITASESYTTFAYDSSSSLIVFRERAWIPYTRIRSYVRTAAQRAAPPLKLDLEARKAPGQLVEWITQFDRLDSVSFEFRHSQSPGAQFIDDLVDDLNAEHVREVLTAPSGEGLNKDKLVGGDGQQAQIVEHLAKNPRNGSARLSGMVGDDYVKVDTNDPVERHRLETRDEAESIAKTLGSLARSLRRT